MIVRLTHRQWDAIDYAIPHGWLWDWVVTEGKITEEHKKLEILLLPDAWREIVDYILPRLGGRRETAPLFDGVRRIVKATNARQEHPAFHGLAVEGRQFEVLPAWEWWPSGEWRERPNGRTHFSPWIPSRDEIQDYKPCNLWPEHQRKQGSVYTKWYHSTLAPEGPISMAAYERFIKARAAA